MRKHKKAAPEIFPGRFFHAPPLLLGALPKQSDGAHSEPQLIDILSQAPLDNTDLLNRSREISNWLEKSELSKFNSDSTARTPPNAPYVLLLDQNVDEIPMTNGMNASAVLNEILVFAQTEIYAAKVVILGAANGQFSSQDENDNVTYLPDHFMPWTLLKSASAVYTHSAGAGFDAILAGHRPRVFGQPWYSGWGLSDDENPDPHRQRRLTRAQLAAAALIEFPQWTRSDGSTASTEQAIAYAEARVRAASEDQFGYFATNILRWKQRFMRQYFASKSISFSAPDTTQDRQKHLAWGATGNADIRIEDGFLRSKGLGAALVRPMSLVLDDLGIYFDPSHPSRLEKHITNREKLPDYAQRRIQALVTHLKSARLSKYNVGDAGTQDIPGHDRILVVGQVEDDASIALGAGEIKTNLGLLQAARYANPDRFIIYKPHPDVEAGLRRGAVKNAQDIADFVAQDRDPIDLIEHCNEVWTMTSLLGFEALLRGKKVTCTGSPFYAGWGLTIDLGQVPARRTAHVTIEGLAHATLIDYPRYFDPETGAAISPEMAVDLLSQARQGRGKISQWLLAKLRILRAIVLRIR